METVQFDSSNIHKELMSSKKNYSIVPIIILGIVAGIGLIMVITKIKCKENEEAVTTN